MKKPRKKAKAKKSNGKARRPAAVPRPRKVDFSKFGSSANPSKEFVDMIQNMDENEIFELMSSLKGALASGEYPELSGETAAELFEQYLNLCDAGEESADERSGLVVDLVASLAQLRLEAAGGDPEARADVADISRTLDQAIDDGRLHGADLMLVAKMLHDADWAVPESLKEALVDEMGTSLGTDPIAGLADTNLLAPMKELADELDGDPFALYPEMSSLLAALPSGPAAQLVKQIARESRGTLDQALIGFFLHPDAALADAVAEVFAQPSSKPVDSLVVERLVRMRPWLAPERRPGLDAAVKALRPNARPPIKIEPQPILKILLTGLDGAGAHSVLITTQGRETFWGHAVLLREGVDDVMALDEERRDDLDAALAELEAWMPTEETDLAGATRMLSLALADNLASGRPPPFQLVRFVEALELSALTPQAMTTAEIVEELLSGLPREATDDAAARRAQHALASTDLISHWFETGEAVEDLLRPIHRFGQRVEKLISVHLPQRRAYWARLLAVSALGLRGVSDAPTPFSVELALMAREFSSDKPIEKLPLMRVIAETSVRAYKQHEGRG